MNREPGAEMHKLLLKAVELRVGGNSWEKVAAVLGRTTSTCRAWPFIYPQTWRRLLHEAQERLAEEAYAESVLVLRQLLRSSDEKVRRDVARLLLTLHRVCTSRDNEEGLLNELLGGLDDPPAGAD